MMNEKDAIQIQTSTQINNNNNNKFRFRNRSNDLLNNNTISPPSASLSLSSSSSSTSSSNNNNNNYSAKFNHLNDNCESVNLNEAYSISNTSLATKPSSLATTTTTTTTPKTNNFNKFKNLKCNENCSSSSSYYKKFYVRNPNEIEILEGRNNLNIESIKLNTNSTSSKPPVSPRSLQTATSLANLSTSTSSTSSAVSSSSYSTSSNANAATTTTTAASSSLSSSNYSNQFNRTKSIHNINHTNNRCVVLILNDNKHQMANKLNDHSIRTNSTSESTNYDENSLTINNSNQSEDTTSNTDLLLLASPSSCSSSPTFLSSISSESSQISNTNSTNTNSITHQQNDLVDDVIIPKSDLSISTNEIDQITTGVVKNLMKKFTIPTNGTNSSSSTSSSNGSGSSSTYSNITNGAAANNKSNLINRSTINLNNIKRQSNFEYVKNFELKKCQSVMFDLDVKSSTSNKNTSSAQVNNIILNSIDSSTNKRAKSNNCIIDLYESPSSSSPFNNGGADKPLSIENSNNNNNNNNQIVAAESYVFGNVDIKERINKFSVSSSTQQPSGAFVPVSASTTGTGTGTDSIDFKRSKKSSVIRHPTHDPMKLGGSCNNLNSESSTTNKVNATKIAPTRIYNKKVAKVSNSSDDASNDDQSVNSTFSDDLTSSSKDSGAYVASDSKIKFTRYKSEISVQEHENLLNRDSSEYLDRFGYEKDERFNFRNNNTNNTNTNNNKLSKETENYKVKVEIVPIVGQSNNNKLINNLIDTSKFEENYKKIKDAFNELKKDNELIESLLTDIRNKVKETTVSFQVANSFDQSENYSDHNETSFVETAIDLQKKDDETPIGSVKLVENNNKINIQQTQPPVSTSPVPQSIPITTSSTQKVVNITINSINNKDNNNNNKSVLVPIITSSQRSNDTNNNPQFIRHKF